MSVNRPNPNLHFADAGGNDGRASSPPLPLHNYTNSPLQHHQKAKTLIYDCLESRYIHATGGWTVYALSFGQPEHSHSIYIPKHCTDRPATKEFPLTADILPVLSHYYECVTFKWRIKYTLSGFAVCVRAMQGKGINRTHAAAHDNAH